ncbi:MAG: helix-turn-helix transcriptional regulator [Selenomonadaceae bacterium]|nr:helix-turn-helix transcriptional regulator [Selenomonadaceae bacterium]
MEKIDDCLLEIQYIGLRIAYFRKLRNLTQADLAEKVSINKNYLSHIESGSAHKVLSLPLLIRISKALDVELALLVDLSDLDNSKNEVREQITELRNMFEEMKQFNAELNDMMAQLNVTDYDIPDEYK